MVGISVVESTLKQWDITILTQLAIAIIGGIAIGYFFAKKLLKRAISGNLEKDFMLAKEKFIKDKITKVTADESSSKGSSKDQPLDFNELVNYLNDKYMLVDITLATYDGLPIASNSQNPEEDSAMAPELLKIIMKQMNTDTAIISGRDYKLAIFEVSPDVICYARLRRDISIAEIDRIRKEIREFMEVRI